MDLFLAGEIVEQVRLAHPRRLGDLVDRRAAEAVQRKHVERRVEDHVLLLALDARLRPVLGRRRHQCGPPRWLASPSIFTLIGGRQSANIFSNWSNFWANLPAPSSANRRPRPTNLRGSLRVSNRQNVAPNDLSAFWMPFTANRQFKKAPRMFVARQGHVLHDLRRPPGARRHGRPVVRQRRPLPARRSSRRSPSRRPRWTTRRPSRWATPRRSSWPIALVGIAPEGLNHVFYTNSGSESVETALKIALAYHRVKGDGSALPADRPRARLSRRQFRRHLGRRHRHQPQDVRHAADRRRPHAAHPHAGQERRSPAASARTTAPSSPTSSSASSRCTTPRPSRR